MPHIRVHFPVGSLWLDVTTGCAPLLAWGDLKREISAKLLTRAEDLTLYWKGSAVAEPSQEPTLVDGDTVLAHLSPTIVLPVAGQAEPYDEQADHVTAAQCLCRESIKQLELLSELYWAGSHMDAPPADQPPAVDRGADVLMESERFCSTSARLLVTVPLLDTLKQTAPPPAAEILPPEYSQIVLAAFAITLEGRRHHGLCDDPDAVTAMGRAVLIAVGESHCIAQLVTRDAVATSRLAMPDSHHGSVQCDVHRCVEALGHLLCRSATNGERAHSHGPLWTFRVLRHALLAHVLFDIDLQGFVADFAAYAPPTDSPPAAAEDIIIAVLKRELAAISTTPASTPSETTSAPDAASPHCKTVQLYCCRLLCETMAELSVILRFAVRRPTPKCRLPEATWVADRCQQLAAVSYSLIMSPAAANFLLQHVAQLHSVIVTCTRKLERQPHACELVSEVVRCELRRSQSTMSSFTSPISGADTATCATHGISLSTLTAKLLLHACDVSASRR